MVYLAEHPVIGRKVALKVIHKELAGNREIVTRFFNEARAVNQIGNEHIVEIHDLGQTPEGDYFFVMEYLHGHTLAEVLQRDVVIDVRRALHISAQIASALGAAHACAIIHRDLKPDNVMLVPRLGDPNFVKVLDFGLAKMFVDQGVQLTAKGVVLGTPQFMSPEACESKKGIDHRADIYSLGVLLFQMVTGELPFDGVTMGEVLVKQVTQAPPAPRGINAAIPPSVEQIILRCLAKTPDARFGSMEELRGWLLHPDAYLSSSPPVMPSAPVPASRQSRTIAVVQPPQEQNQTIPGGVHAPVHQPVVPKNHTMRIDTPSGYRPRKRWPVIVAVASITAVVALITALVVTGNGQAGESTSENTAAASEPDAGPPPDARPVMVEIDLSTEPAGAEVFDVNEKRLGKTPLTITLPKDGKEHELIIRHPMAKERRKTVRATGDAELELELELVENDSNATKSDKKRTRRRRKPKKKLIDF